MPAERAGYTVTMFLIDISSSMGAIRTVDIETPDGHTQSVEMTNLQWGLQYVKLKVQEMVYNGRKTDQCGVIVFGSEHTRNIVNAANGGYDNVLEYIPIAQPNSNTITKIDALEPSSVSGDPVDALIVGIETQAKYLVNKKTWTRKIILVTDAESPIELEDWEATAKKMNQLNVSLTVVGIDFDDEEHGYHEPNKSNIKRTNEGFYVDLTSTMESGIVGSCEYVLQNISAPESKTVKSVLLGTVIRVGDVFSRSDEALEFSVKASKATAVARPKSWKKFILRTKDKVTAPDGMVIDEEPEGDDEKSAYAQLRMRTDFYIDRNAVKEEEIDEDVEMKEEDDNAMLLEATQGEDADRNKKKNTLEKVEKEVLVRGFKYGTTYAPCLDGQFPRLQTHKGIDICGFFPIKNFRRELSMSEVQYIWADPSSPQEQVALSSVVQAMVKKGVMAIGRWVSRDGMDPKMGVLMPVENPGVHYFLWCQMPFADDVRKYSFASLDHLVNKKGQVISEHPYLPTEKQLAAMDDFVDAMDLMSAGKDEDGNRVPWFNPIEVYNPAVHRVKQAMFHCAVVNDIATNPLPPPHPELTKYFEPPKKVLKKAQNAIEECQLAFNVKEVPKRVTRAKKDTHAHAHDDDDDDMLLLDEKKPSANASHYDIVGASAIIQGKGVEIEDDDDDLMEHKKLSMATPANEKGGPLPTLARSISPLVDPGIAPGRIIGNTYPLKDFKKNLAQGDVVTKAVEDLSSIIVEVVMRPFGSRRTQEMLDCMIQLRNTCLTEDEIAKWNSFIVDLKQKCLSKAGNLDFWRAVQDFGRGLSLISKQEAKQQGGESDVTENDAGEFISSK
ncbi:SPOC domain-like protein [Pholiota conissans]|uniref:ATP-dependent DNA helicase II subunit 2 n=1 Tax=Pholiota conissans TaxID=109636 RepID=A0A9P5Z2U5_9AGAR|nr:SPOC domain-like protein [Pholiota conissans]